MFYGIVITMYNNGSEHNPPHFHARYAGHNAVFNLEGDLMTSSLQNRVI